MNDEDEPIKEDGALADRVQTMRFRRALPPSPLLEVHVSKEFKIERIS